MLLFLIINLQFKGLERNWGDVNEKKGNYFNKILSLQIRNYLYYNNLFIFFLLTIFALVD
jgi:hypothetical protein